MTRRKTNRGITRRAALQAGLLGAGAMMAPMAFGQTRVTVDEANLRPRPIAIPDFLSEDPRLGAEIAGVVAADLESSGLFRPLDRAAFIEQIRDINIAPRFADWRSIGAEGLVLGRVGRMGDGRLRAEFRLWDTVLGKPLAGQQFSTIQANWRRIGHIVADQVYEKLTVEKGYFGTRIVFIDETGPQDRRHRRLAIMGPDGAKVRMLSVGRELVLTPRFSPTSQGITYMVYTRDQPRVMLMRLDTGEQEVVGDFPGMTFAPRFSPDGQRIIMSFQIGGASSI